MKRITWHLHAFLCVVVALAVAGCSGDPGKGTLSINVADAKPSLPIGDIEKVLVTFDQCSVHKAGGEWIDLPLANDADEYTIDLIQFTDGTKTALVLPVSLESGTYTQIRFGVTRAVMKTSDDEEYLLDIPSENLKTDKNLELDLPVNGSIALVVHFDLSQSIVATGSDAYMLKPVLHILKDSSTITGVLDNTIFGDATTAEVVVWRDEDADGDASDGDVEYTRLIVDKAEVGDTTSFSVYWVIPDQDYVVQVLGAFVYEEGIAAKDIPSNTVFSLNGGEAIKKMM